MTPRFLWLLCASLLFASSGADCVCDCARANSDDDALAMFSFSELQGMVVRDLTSVDPIELRFRQHSASWRPGRLQVNASGIIETAAPPSKLYAALNESQSFTIEMWITPTGLNQSGPARILSLSKDTSLRNLTIGQDGDKIDVRLRHSASDQNGMPSLQTPSGALKNGRNHLVVSKDKTGSLAVYLNGLEAAKKTVEGDMNNWDTSYRLLLANEATGDRPWLGSFEHLAIFAKALSPEEILERYRSGETQATMLSRKLPPAIERSVDFVTDVLPILRDRCFDCHTSGNEEGGLNLGLRARTLEGGAHGPALEPGDSAYSLMIHLVAGLDSSRVMPPDDEPLSKEDIGILRSWIDQGAIWPSSAEVADARAEKGRDHWAFQRLRSIEVPPAVDEKFEDSPETWKRLRTPIDAFILDKQRALSLPYALPAAPEQLVRRLTFDLTGLPPTPEQIERFRATYDPREKWPAGKFIDELLDSPHYGERWGRHWLDAARFAESDGQESDEDRPQAYLYRDFVINAFNSDMPYDQFVRWQIAGDEFEPNNDQAIIATGYLTGGPHSALGDTFIEEEQLFNRYNELDDVVSTIGSGMLGLTLACARCHDHKYDAISAREYYRLISAFHSGDRKKGKLPGGQDALFFRDFDDKVRTTWYFRRANFYDRELEVQLGFPAVLSLGTQAEDYWQRARAAVENPKSTLQRRALADWLVDVDRGAGPLLARVLVNRVWQHHFGVGLVSTPGDFGVQGDAPSHPELLEFLANDFVSHGWQIKRLHRMILNSATWQQSRNVDSSAMETVSAEPNSIDLANRYLWKRTPTRLEAEVIRDSMLAVSGTLNSQVGGPSFKPHIPAEANLARNLKGERYPDKVPDSPEVRRRSIYLFHKRLLPYPLLQAFDRPDLLVSCTIRQNTTVAPQALALMNDETVRLYASDFASRLRSEHLSDAEQTAKRAFLLALGRQPTEQEIARTVEFLSTQTQRRSERGEADAEHQALTDFCQVIFGLNEFLYVD